MFTVVLILTVIVLAICFAAIGIKMFVRKDGRFERHCANAGDSDVGCMCGGRGGEFCRNRTNKGVPS